MQEHYRIIQVSASRFRVQLEKERTEGLFWWRKTLKYWDFIMFYDKNQSTYMPGLRVMMPGKWVPMNYNSLAEAERHIAELRIGYPLVVKDPA